MVSVQTQWSLTENIYLTLPVLTLGRQPQYMRDKPTEYLFVDVDDCCKARKYIG